MRLQAHGVIGNEGSTPTEVEQAPAVSLTLANMEGAEVASFTVTGERLPDAGAPNLQSLCCSPEKLLRSGAQQERHTLRSSI